MAEVRVLRRATTDELAELAELLGLVVADGASVGFLPPLAPAEAERYWRQALAGPATVFVAEQAGRIVGSVQLQPAPQPNARHRAEVAKLLVHPAFRRRGLARRLMAALEAAARADGRTLLVLDTRAGDPSNDLYRSLGYLEAGRVPRYARSADGSLAATVIYYKEVF
jgi:ribosomal protein S18 acetylase RimI-like enzyme